MQRERVSEMFAFLGQCVVVTGLMLWNPFERLIERFQKKPPAWEPPGPAVEADSTDEADIREALIRDWCGKGTGAPAETRQAKPLFLSFRRYRQKDWLDPSPEFLARFSGEGRGIEGYEVKPGSRAVRHSEFYPDREPPGGHDPPVDPDTGRAGLTLLIKDLFRVAPDMVEADQNHWSIGYCCRLKRQEGRWTVIDKRISYIS